MIAAIGKLQDIGVVALVELRHEDVAALDQPDAALRADAESSSMRWTQGPAALTIARAETSWPSERLARQTSPSRRADSRATPTRISAPLAAASTALSTVRRKSSTEASE